MRHRPYSLKLHVRRGDRWLPVFCYHDDGRIITCENRPELALPTKAPPYVYKQWAKDDLAFFSSKFANDVFELRHIDTSATRAT